MNNRNLTQIAAILCGLAVIAGAFGRHALASLRTARDLEIWSTAAHYQLVHGVALLALAALPLDRLAKSRAAGLLLAGTLVFSGSLYLLVLLQIRKLGMVTPIGGVLMISGWFVLAWSASKMRTSAD